MLNSLKCLSLAEDSQPNYIRLDLGADDGQFRFPPATHFIAMVEDLADEIYYDSEDIDDMDDDAGEEEDQNQPFTGRWTTTSSYDVYMVGTPEEDGDYGKKDPVEDKPAEAPPKRRRQRRRSKSRRDEDNNTGTGDNNTPENAENPDAPV